MEIAKWTKGDKPIPIDFVGLLDMSEADYHSDPCEAPTLSSSIAKKIVAQSPLHGWLYHPKLGGMKKEATKAMNKGTIIHALIFDEKPNVALVDEKDWKKKVAYEARDSAIAEGRIPYLLGEYREAEAIAEEVREALQRESIHLSGQTECVGIWQERVNDRNVQCRCRYDHTIADEGIIFDFKTCSDGHPEHLSRHIVDMGYDIQFAAYDSALGQIMDLSGRIDFSWVFIEEMPEGAPKKCIVEVIRPSGIMRELGRHRWQKALSLWHECLESNHWPAYTRGPTMIDPPEWRVKKELGRE